MTDLAEKTHGFACQACDTRVDRWMPRCPSCGQMGMIRSLVKIQAATLEIAKAARTHQTSRDIAPRRRESSEPTPLDDVPPEPAPEAQPIPITEVPEESYRRLLTGLAPLDRVLGGGLVLGSITLLGGFPGAGKSTALIQMAANLTAGTVLYASGEESPGQVADRARRVNAAKPHIQILHESRIERVLAHAERLAAPVLVADSMHTLTTDDAPGAAGSVSQVRACAERLMNFAKRTGTTTIAIGHITKDGGLAGPKTLEHLVDATLLIEPWGGLDPGETPYRILRAFKNRFGAVTETGAFEMRPDGLYEAFDLPMDPDGGAESLVPVAQEILNRYRQLGGDVDEGLRDRIAGRLSCDEEIGP